MKYIPYCYRRLSTMSQVVSGQGLDDQRSIIERFLEENAEKFTGEPTYITDEGISAYKDANIAEDSALGLFLKDVKEHRIGFGSALLVTSLDRLSRRNAWSENTIQFIVNSDVVVFDISTGLVLKKDDPFTKIHMEIILSRSHNESLMKSVRAKTAWENKVLKAVEKGEVLSNKLPRWLENVDNKYALKPGKAEEIRQIFEWYIHGYSTGQIVKMLNDGSRLVTISKLLRDRRLIGEHKRLNGQILPSVYPIVVEPEKFAIVQNLIDSNKAHVGNAPDNLLENTEEVEEIFRLTEEGLSTGQIVRKLKNGWTTVNVLRVLRDEEVVKKEIIDNLTFKRVQERLTKKGIAKRVRKDITRSENDVITNLFAPVLHCGLCGGRVALHYNHLKTKYISCRTREEKKTCTAKGVQYIHLEENILSTIRKINFSALMDSEENKNFSGEAKKAELQSLRAEEKRYIDAIKERELQKKRKSFELQAGLSDVRDAIEELAKEIANNKTLEVLPAFNFDMSKALDPENLEIRAAIKKEIKQVVRTINYVRFDKYISVEMKYFTDVLRHVLIIKNKGGELVANIAIQDHGDSITYETPSFVLVEDKENRVCSIDDKYKVTVQDYGLLLNYMQGIADQKIVDYMIANMPQILCNN